MNLEEFFDAEPSDQPPSKLDDFFQPQEPKPENATPNRDPLDLSLEGRQNLLPLPRFGQQILEQEMRRSIPDLPSDDEMQERLKTVAKAREKLSSGESVQGQEVIGPRQRALGQGILPFTGPVVRALERKDYSNAMRRLLMGKTEPDDEAKIAKYELQWEQDAKLDETLGGTLQRAALGAPGMIGEFMAGGAVVRGAATLPRLFGAAAPAAETAYGAIRSGTLPLQMAKQAAGAAAMTPLVPSLYVDRWTQQNLAAGRDPFDPEGLLSSLGVGAMKNVAFSQVGNVIGTAIPGKGLLPAAERVASQAGAAPVTSAAADIASRATGLTSDWGPILEAIGEGNYGEAIKHAATDAITFAAFQVGHEFAQGGFSRQDARKALEAGFNAEKGRPAERADGTPVEDVGRVEPVKERSEAGAQEAIKELEKLPGAAETPDVQRQALPAPGDTPGAQEVKPPAPPPTEPTLTEGRDSASVRNKATDIYRQELGMGERPKVTRESREEVIARARELVATNQASADTIIEQVLANPRTINRYEQAIISAEKAKIEREGKQLREDARKARESGDDSLAQALDEAANAYVDRARKFVEASELGGTDPARDLSFRQWFIKEDHSVGKMLFDLEKSGPVKESTKKRVVQLSDELQAAKQRIDELEASRESMRAAEPSRRQQRKQSAQKEFDQAWEDFRRVTSGKLFSNPLDPEVLSATGRLAVAAIKKGIVKVEDFIADVAAKIGKPAGEKERKVLTEAWIQAKNAERAERTEALKNRATKGGDKAMSRIASQLAEEALEAGFKGREDVLDYVHQTLMEIDPSMTRSEAGRHLSGYGQFQPLNKDPIKVELRDIKGQLQQIGKLEDMAEGQAPAKTGFERRTPTAEERELIKEVGEAKKKGGYNVTDPETQLKSALGAIKTRLQHQIEDLTKQIESRQKITKDKTPIQYDREAEQLRSRRDQLKEQFEEIFGKEERTDAEKIATAKKILSTRREELERRIAEKDFAPVPKRAGPTDQELQQARIEYTKRKDEYERLKRDHELANASVLAKASRVASEATNGIMRTLMASIDAATGRQLLPFTSGHPIRAARQIPEFWKAFFSEAASERVRDRWEQSPNFKSGLSKRAGLDLTGKHGEEGFMGHIFEQLDRIPKVGPYIKHVNLPEMSERSFRTATNNARQELFDIMVNNIAKPGEGISDANAKVIGNFVNEWTGRLSPGSMKAAAQKVNWLFFAAQWSVSTLKTAFGVPLVHRIREPGFGWKETKAARIEIAKQYARSVAGLATVLGVIKAASYAFGKDKIDVSLDPTSSDFGQAKIEDTRIDMLGPWRQWWVLAGRVLSGIRTNVEGRESKVGIGQLAGETFMKKLAPAPSLAAELWTGRNAINQKITPAEAIMNKFMPLIGPDAYDAMVDLGVPKSIIPIFLGLHGFSLSTYESKRTKPR